MKKDSVLIIDFDSTFVQGETLEELAEIALAKNPKRKAILSKMKMITRQGMEGKISFENSLHRRIQLFSANKQNVKQLATELKKRITPSIQNNKVFFQDYHAQIYVISGGFLDYIFPVVKDFGIQKNHILANCFIYDKKGNIVGYDESIPLCKKGGKVEVVRRLNLKKNIYVVGDGYTDYELKKEKVAYKFIAFTENVHRENVKKQADIVVSSFDECVKVLS